MLRFKSTLLICFIFLVSTGSNCKRNNLLDSDGLPKASQSGKNIFACKVNGRNWISTSKTGIPGAIVKDDMLVVEGADPKDSEFGGELFSIRVHDILSNSSTYRLNNPSIRFAEYRSSRGCFTNTNSILPKASDGEVTFTKIDRGQKIISGTFWLDIPTDNCETLKITDGRFDIRYY